MLLSCAGIFVIFFQVRYTVAVDEYDLLVLTFADKETDSFRRFNHSAKVYGLNVKALQHLKDLKCSDSDGDQEYCEKDENTKIKQLREHLEQFKNKNSMIIMILDSLHAVLNTGKEEIIRKFLNKDANIVFAAAEETAVNLELQFKFPEVDGRMKYLSSSTAFMGYATNIYDLVTHAEKKNHQLTHEYFVSTYIDGNKRQAFGIKIDHTADIFHEVQEGRDYEAIVYEEETTYVSNKVFNSRPAVIIANAKNQHVINVVGDYVAKAYRKTGECIECIDLKKLKESDYPLIIMGVFVEQASTFFEEFLIDVYNLNYPKQRIHLYIHMANQYNEEQVKGFLDKNGEEYQSVTYYGTQDNITELDARNKAIQVCLQKQCDFYFNVDVTAHLDNRQTLRKLILQHRAIVAPLLTKKYKSKVCNFQRQVAADGFEVKAFDGEDIRKSRIRGTWNVGCVTSCYLINSRILHKNNKPLFKYDNIRSQTTFCHDMRTKGIFMYLSNRLDFGHLVIPHQFNKSKIHIEMYEIFKNPWDWTQRYIVSNYSTFRIPEEPCKYVFWFPLFTPRFCTDLIDIMEGHGTWNNGKTDYNPVIDGLDQVPAIDMVLMKVGLLEHWKKIVEKFVLPLQDKIYPIYVSEHPDLNKTYVIKYQPEGIPELEPHDDLTSFTINIALNQPGVDYEGGGVKFINYNCSVVDSRVGWLLIYPGAQTHFHQGLPTTKGTRYVLVSLVDAPR